MSKITTLLCTVGVSLFYPNLKNLPSSSKEYNDWIKRQPEADRKYFSEKAIFELNTAFRALAWKKVAKALYRLPHNTRLLGAEINSIYELSRQNIISEKNNIVFCHSDTDDGRQIAKITEYFYQEASACCSIVQIKGLTDEDPALFRKVGLRSLVKEICKVIQERGQDFCGINATGGYKAQIAIAVVIGQVTSVPVYYKHERFNEIISLPPLPVSFDVQSWFDANHILYSLNREGSFIPFHLFKNDWKKRFESLIERVDIEGQEYIELSAMGQLFHEHFRHQYQIDKKKLLPCEATKKKSPRLESSGWPGAHPEVEQFMKAVTTEIPQVIQCATFYYNPNLSEETRFNLGTKGLECIFSPKGYCVKFKINTTAKTKGEEDAMVAELNDWLSKK